VLQFGAKSCTLQSRRPIMFKRRVFVTGALLYEIERIRPEMTGES